MSLMVSGKFFTGQGILEGSVLIEEGRIVKIAKAIQGRADEVLDFNRKGYVVLPGLVDIHVHMRDFELSYKEDFQTGTSAAAMGGFTAIADMPNTRPKVNYLSILEERERVANNKSLVDYGLYLGVPDREEDLVDDVKSLAVGFKVFMLQDFYTERLRLAEKVFEFASRKKMLVVAHAESPKFFKKTAFGNSGTPEAEVQAIKDISSFSLKHAFKLHLTHLSSAAGAKESMKWKNQATMTTDTCPHYLFLTEEDTKQKGAIAKVDPSLKDKADAEFLLDRVKDGSIDAISSDHAPHSLEEKRGSNPPSGFPGLESTLPLLLTLVNKGLLRIEDVVRTCATNPTKVLGLDRAGEIEEGKMANLTVVDLHRETKIEPKNFKSKAKYSPFEGMELKGMPIATIVRGQSIMLDGEIVGMPGWGKNVKTYS